MRQHAREQARGQTHRPDRLQSLQPARHSGHPGLARVAAHEVQQRPGAGGGGLVLVASLRRGARRGRAQQGVEPLAHLGRQPGMDGGVEAVLVGTHGAADDAPDAVRGGRLDAERTAALFQPGGEAAVVADFGDGVVTQPGPERLGVCDRRLAEAEQGADLGPLPLQRTISGVEQQRPGVRLRHAERARQFGHRALADLVDGAWEAAAGAEEQQQDGEAQPVAPALGLDQEAIRRRQVPDPVAACGGTHARLPARQ